MARASAQAENIKAAPKAFSAVDPFMAAWPMASSGASPPAALESFRRMSEIQMEMTRFWVDRARKNAGALSAFVTCRSPKDFLEIWRNAAIEAVTDYADEAARLLDHTQK